jgi:hypothetical protein
MYTRVSQGHKRPIRGLGVWLAPVLTRLYLAALVRLDQACRTPGQKHTIVGALSSATLCTTLHLLAVRTRTGWRGQRRATPKFSSAVTPEELCDEVTFYKCCCGADPNLRVRTDVVVKLQEVGTIQGLINSAPSTRPLVFLPSTQRLAQIGMEYGGMLGLLHMHAVKNSLAECLQERNRQLTLVKPSTSWHCAVEPSQGLADILSDILLHACCVERAAVRQWPWSRHTPITSLESNSRTVNVIV